MYLWFQIPAWIVLTLFLNFGQILASLLLLNFSYKKACIQSVENRQYTSVYPQYTWSSQYTSVYHTYTCKQYTPVYISLNKQCIDPYTHSVRNTKGILILTHPGHNAFSTCLYTLYTSHVLMQDTPVTVYMTFRAVKTKQHKLQNEAQKWREKRGLLAIDKRTWGDRERHSQSWVCDMS